MVESSPPPFRKKSSNTRSPALFTPLVFILFLCFLYRAVVISNENCKVGLTTEESLSSSTTSSHNATINNNKISNDNNDNNNNNHGATTIDVHPGLSLFDDTLIPSNSELDVNIGTNNSPIGPQGGRHRILVDPLFHICEQNAKLTTTAGEGNVTSFCFAVSDFTGFAIFYEYNEARSGASSSLSQVTQGTSHERFPIVSTRTVLVLEATELFEAIRKKGSTIYRLKLDMQGHELKTLANIQGLLRDDTTTTTNLVTHILAECFCPNPVDGKQIYQIDNSCRNISKVLQGAGYETKWSCPNHQWGDVYAYKKAVANDYLSKTDFESVPNQYSLF